MDRFRQNRVVLVAERVGGDCILHTHCSGNFSGKYLLHFFAIICVHAHDAPHALAVTRAGVIYIRTGGKRSGIDAKIRELPHKRICLDLKRDRRKRSCISRFADFFRARVRVHTFDRQHINGRRKIINNRIKCELNAFILERGSGKHRNKLVGKHRPTRHLF